MGGFSVAMSLLESSRLGAWRQRVIKNNLSKENDSRTLAGEDRSLEGRSWKADTLNYRCCNRSATEPVYVRWRYR